MRVTDATPSSLGIAQLTIRIASGATTLSGSGAVETTVCGGLDCCVCSLAPFVLGTTGVGLGLTGLGAGVFTGSAGTVCALVVSGLGRAGACAVFTVSSDAASSFSSVTLGSIVEGSVCGSADFGIATGFKNAWPGSGRRRINSAFHSDLLA